MDIPAATFDWCRDLNVLTLDHVDQRTTTGVHLTERAAEGLENGHIMYRLCEAVAAEKGMTLAVKSENLAGDPDGDFTSMQNKLYNWNVVSEALMRIATIEIGPDQRMLVVSGDRDVLCDIVGETHTACGSIPVVKAREVLTVESRKGSGVTGSEHGDSGNGSIRRSGPNSPGDDELLGEGSMRRSSQSLKKVSKGKRKPVRQTGNRNGARSLEPGEKPGSMASPRSLSAMSPRGNDFGASDNEEIDNEVRKVLAKIDWTNTHESLKFALERRERRRIKQEIQQRREEEEKERHKSVRAMYEARLDLDKLREEREKVRGVSDVYKEFQNHAAVRTCFELVWEMVASVESGEAQAEFNDRERKRQHAIVHARERKKTDQRLVDGFGLIAVPKTEDHNKFLSMKHLVLDMVRAATARGARERLEERERRKSKERAVAVKMMTRYKREHEEAMMQERNFQKAEREAREKSERERIKEEKRQAQFDRMRHEIRERTKAEYEQRAAEREQKEAEEQAELDKQQRKEREMQRYFGAQRMKTVEIAARRKVSDEEQKQWKVIAARQRQWEIAQTVAKVREKEAKEEELRKEREMRVVPDSLSAESLSTGDSAAYQGQTLGWQYMTETEFDIATAVIQVRAEPKSVTEAIQERSSSIHQHLWGQEVGGTLGRVSMHCSEGRPACHDALSFIHKQKASKPLKDANIGLTLTARQHAMDLVYHGIADSQHHNGTDGTSPTARIQRFCSFSRAHKTYSTELIFAVVKPKLYPIAPADVIASWVINDGVGTRQDRRMLFSNEVSYFGVGHAVGSFDETYEVVVYVVLLTSPVDNRTVGQMAVAQQTAAYSLAPGYLTEQRAVAPFITEQQLFSAPNACIRIVRKDIKFNFMRGKAGDAPKKKELSMRPW